MKKGGGSVRNTYLLDASLFIMTIVLIAEVAYLILSGTKIKF